MRDNSSRIAMHNEHGCWDATGFLAAKLQKASMSFVMSGRPSLCLSVRMEQLGYHWTEFHEI